MSVFSSVSIVIPVYNERESLPELLRELRMIADQLSDLTWEFLFVDDGSRDGGTELLTQAAAQDKRVKVIVFVRNFGQTAAMSAGIRVAKGEVIVPMDADLQNDPADIPHFLTKLGEGYDCVSGWRKERQDGFFLRRLPSHVANWMISRATGVSLHDYGCSLKAYKRSYLQGVALYGEMHRFIPAYISWSGGRVTEMVTHHRARKFGVSKYGLSRVPKVLLDLLVVKFLTNYFNKPMHIFGGVGVLSVVLGIVSEFAAIYFKLFGGKSFVQTPLPIVGAMFVVVGVQLIMTGLLAEVLMRTYYETQDRQVHSIKTTINV
jgi:glycosyltransferase involved in cell wall biosynthesis